MRQICRLTSTQLQVRHVLRRAFTVGVDMIPSSIIAIDFQVVLYILFSAM